MKAFLEVQMDGGKLGNVRGGHLNFIKWHFFFLISSEKYEVANRIFPTSFLSQFVFFYALYIMRWDNIPVLNLALNFSVIHRSDTVIEKKI